MSWLGRLFRHRLFDERDASHVLDPAARERIAQRVTASEKGHSGEIRVCIEAGLPFSYVRRGATARQRALALFGKLGVWDTEQNNGVLIYLLLAEHCIEIVADRGLQRRVGDAAWAGLAAEMAEAFRRGDFEAGLFLAIDRVDEWLRAHFAVDAAAPNANELPDAPVIL
jgi:uncharacterized membrane protein